MRKKPFVRSVLERRDYAIMGELIEDGTRVLDLGCGDGSLLAWLRENRHVDARGVELDTRLVQQAIARGVSVYQGDIEEALEDYPDSAFDYVVLSQTLQQTRHPVQVLEHMLRVGRRIIVAFPNFGHWSVRLAHLFSGRAPQNKLFPFEWHDSPNIHFLTVLDFEVLCAQKGWRVDRRYFLSGNDEVSWRPNLTAEVAVFLLHRG
jgi:methionine biosynthesis protein MetW